MIINANDFMDSFKCNKILADYLIYEKKLSLLSLDNGYFNFAKTKLLEEILESLPFWLKILNKFGF